MHISMSCLKDKTQKLSSGMNRFNRISLCHTTGKRRGKPRRTCFSLNSNIYSILFCLDLTALKYLKLNCFFFFTCKKNHESCKRSLDFCPLLPQPFPCDVHNKRFQVQMAFREGPALLGRSGGMSVMSLYEFAVLCHAGQPTSL